MFLLVFIVVPVVEILAFVEVAMAIGWLWALLLLFGTSILGFRMARSQGRTALRELSAALSERRPPRVRAMDGALGSIGGLLLLVPGFVTDAVGLVLLLPPAKRLLRGWLSSRYGGRVVGYATRSARFTGGGSTRRPADVESTAIEEDVGQLPL